MNRLIVNDDARLPQGRSMCEFAVGSTADDDLPATARKDVLPLLFPGVT